MHKASMWTLMGCLASVTAAGAMTGCSAKKEIAAGGAGVQRSSSMVASGSEDAESAHCKGTDARYEVSEYDTSGDEQPDVRKVFLRIGEGTLARLVLVCRETDLNSDNVKDVVRYYSEEGRPLREEADRNFDGRMDEMTIFQDGQILRQEFDTSYDGIVDTKIFYDAGKPLRAERDLSGHSTDKTWKPDRWEYYEDGHIVRMGSDLDGDGIVDRWDRDAKIRPAVQTSDTGAGDSA